MSIEPEFNSFLEKQPASVRLYPEVLLHTDRHLSDLHQQFADKYGHLPLHRGDFIKNSDASLHSIPVMSANAIKVFGLAPPPVEYRSAAVEICIELFNEDGSEHILEEDKGIIDSVGGIPQSSNRYMIFCFPEHQPFLINQYEFEKHENAIRHEKIKAEATYPHTIPSVEDLMTIYQQQGVKPRYLDETTCGQIITILNCVNFAPDFKDFEEMEPASNQ